MIAQEQPAAIWPTRQFEMLVVLAAGAVFQTFAKMQPLFSRALMVPGLSNLLPLFIGISLVNTSTEFPATQAVLEQVFATLCKLAILYFVVSRYSHNEELVVGAFLILTHSGLLNPKMYRGDPTYSTHLRFFEDCLIMNLFARFMKQRKLQMYDSMNAMSRLLSTLSSYGGAFQDTSRRRPET